MTRDYVWRWELSPIEIKLGHVYTPHAPPPSLVRAVSGFDGQRRPLPGAAGLTFQFGIGSGSVASDIVGLYEAQPDLERTGSRRSGIIVFDGDRLVANFVWGGKRVRDGRALYVDPAYRGRRLSQLMLLEWSKRTKRPRKLSPIDISPGAAISYLRSDRMLYEWAEAEGRASVAPEVVVRELAFLERLIARVGETGEAIAVTQDMLRSSAA